MTTWGFWESLDLTLPGGVSCGKRDAHGSGKRGPYTLSINNDGYPDLVAIIIDINLARKYDEMMRTTITIDDSLADRIEELRRKRGLSMKKVIDLLLRDGLECESKPPRPKRFRTRTHRLGLRPGFDPAKLNQLADELESEAFLERELRRRR